MPLSDLFFHCLNSLQTITRVPSIISNVAVIAAFPNDGFAMEQTTAVTMRMRPTLHAQVCTAPHCYHWLSLHTDCSVKLRLAPKQTLVSL